MDNQIISDNFDLIKQFRDYISYDHKSKCKINHPILDRFYRQQIVQKTFIFDKIKPYINKDSKILDISTGMGFFPLICLLSGYKNIEYSEINYWRNRGYPNDKTRAIIYQNSFDWLHEHFKTEPFIFKFFKDKPCQLPKKYNIITCIGAGFLNYFSGEQIDFLIEDVLKYTDIFYLRTNHTDRSMRKLNLDSELLPFEYYRGGDKILWESRKYKLIWSSEDGGYIYFNGE